MEAVEVKKLIDEALARHVYDHHKNKCATLFKPPAREDVIAYCRERNLALDVDKFMDFYTSKGWKVGKVTMKDWRATARNAVRDGWCRVGVVGAPVKMRPKCNGCRQPADFRYPDGSPFCKTCQPKGYAMYGDNL